VFEIKSQIWTGTATRRAYLLAKELVSLLVFRSRNGGDKIQRSNLALWGLGTNGYGHMSVQGVDVVELVREFGSPLFVVNQDKLREDAGEILEAMASAPPGSVVLYSYKTNCIPAILKEVHSMRIGAEVISPYELWLAQRLGVPGDMIVYNGVNKTQESIELATRLNVLAINIDHIEEIERICRVAQSLNRRIRVGVRLGLIPGSQFGLEIESGEALRACRQIASLSNFLDLICVHFNITSNANIATLHKSCALQAVEFMARIKNSTGITIPYLDVGGGFGIPTAKNLSSAEYAMYRTVGSLLRPPSFGKVQPIKSFVAEIVNTVRDACRIRSLAMPKIIIEPGRFVTSRSELLLASVLAIKEKANGTRFAITDAGRLSIAFPCDFEYHEAFCANRIAAPLTTPYQVMGRICTSADWLFKNRFMPNLASGDVLAVMDAGAYFSSYSTNFSFPRPPIIMVSDGKARVIRREETFEHLTAMDTSL
jgi:diaminopimelate decarboxylase